MFNKSFSILSIVFLIMIIPTLIFADSLDQHGFDSTILIRANILLVVITHLSMKLLSKALIAKTTAQFLQHTYGSILIKLFVCAIAAFIYIYTSKGHISKRTLFACMAIYLVYTFIERRIIIQHSKERKNENKTSS